VDRPSRILGFGRISGGYVCVRNTVGLGGKGLWYNVSGKRQDLGAKKELGGNLGPNGLKGVTVWTWFGKGFPIGGARKIGAGNLDGGHKRGF